VPRILGIFAVNIRLSAHNHRSIIPVLIPLLSLAY